MEVIPSHPITSQVRLYRRTAEAVLSSSVNETHLEGVPPVFALKQMLTKLHEAEAHSCPGLLDNMSESHSPNPWTGLQ